MDELRTIDKRNLIGCLFILAMMAAPFIALIYGFGFALLVLTLGLLLTAALALDARNQVAPERQRTVVFMGIFAFGLAILTGIVAFSRFR